MPAGRTARRLRRHCARSTRPPANTLQDRRYRTLLTVPGARNTRPSCNRGSALGSMSSRSWCFHQKFWRVVYTTDEIHKPSQRNLLVRYVRASSTKMRTGSARRHQSACLSGIRPDPYRRSQDQSHRQITSLERGRQIEARRFAHAHRLTG